MTSTPAPGDRAAAAAPGWYPDPKMAATLRYWDGEDWTDSHAPNQASAVAAKDYSSLVTWGWIALLFFPPAAFVIGVVLDGKSKAAGWLILLSIIWTIVSAIAFYAVISAANQPTYYYTP